MTLMTPLSCTAIFGHRLKEFNEWGQNVVMKVLLHYSPVDSEEMYDILNVLDDRLNHTNSSVVMSAVALFLRLTEDYIEMHSDVYERIKSEYWYHAARPWTKR